MVMYRTKIAHLEKWKNSKNRKPLIIKGARQVGKTWLMKEFGEKYYDKCAYVNFDNNPQMKELFSGDYNIDRIIQGLKIETGVNIEKENTLIIFDEIGEVPKALTSLKYFYENAPFYHIVAAGSLLGVAMHEGTSFPVGKVDFMTLHPLDFIEFLMALGENDLTQLIQRNDVSLCNAFHDKLINYLKEYFYIGGMPEVVCAYAENKDYQEVRDIQNRLLVAYEQDFSKHAPNIQVPRIRELWNNIPTQLAKENKKFIYGVVREGARAREYENALLWLIDAGLVYKVNRVNDYKIPLSGYQDFSAFKLYLFDVGLLSAMANIDIKTLLEKETVFTEFKGALTECYVLEELIHNREKEIFYWASSTNEIDFIMQIDNKIIPIEVKASVNLQAKSLKNFIQKYNSLINIRTSMAKYKKEEKILNVPLYLIGNLEEMVK